MTVGDIRRQIAAEWLEIVQLPQWRAYRKTVGLSNATIADSHHLPSPKTVVPNASQDQLRDACYHLLNFAYDMSRAMLPFAKLLRPLLV